MKYNHIGEADLYGNGVAYEILIIKEDKNRGDLYFIKVEDLDEIDRRRMRSILKKRNAQTMPLWDLMDQVTLKNGLNALDYFHQLVNVRTKSGQIIKPSMTRRGVQPQETKRGPGRPSKNNKD